MLTAISVELRILPFFPNFSVFLYSSDSSDGCFMHFCPSFTAVFSRTGLTSFYLELNNFENCHNHMK